MAYTRSEVTLQTPTVGASKGCGPLAIVTKHEQLWHFYRPAAATFQRAVEVGNERWRIEDENSRLKAQVVRLERELRALKQELAMARVFEREDD